MTQTVEPPVEDAVGDSPRFAVVERPEETPPRDEPTAQRRPLLGRLRLAQWVLIIVALLAVVLVAGVIVGAEAIAHEDDARREIIDQLDPARTASLEVGSAIVAQQNAVRGFALTGQERNLESYRGAIASERRATEGDPPPHGGDSRGRRDRRRRGAHDGRVAAGLRRGGDRAGAARRVPAVGARTSRAPTHRR